MSIYSLTCPDVGCYTNFSCDPEFQNKIVAVAYVKKAFALTALEKSTPAGWKSALLGRYAAGTGLIVFNTSGDKPKPDTATTTGRGMQNTKALAKTHTLNYTDMQGVVKENVEFYNEILSTSQDYDFYYFTPNRIWDASGSYVTIIGDPVITAELNTYQMAEVTVTWISKVNPLPYEFDTDEFLEGLKLNISYDGVPELTYAVQGACQDKSSITFEFAFSQTVSGASPSVVWTVDVLGADVTADFDDPFSSTPNLLWCTEEVATFPMQVTCTTVDGCIYGIFDFTVAGI
jgi:hypothetical protein